MQDEALTCGETTCRALRYGQIILAVDYLWRSSAKVGAGKFRPLRPLLPALTCFIFRFLRCPLN